MIDSSMLGNPAFLLFEKQVPILGRGILSNIVLLFEKGGPGCFFDWGIIVFLQIDWRDFFLARLGRLLSRHSTIFGLDSLSFSPGTVLEIYLEDLEDWFLWGGP